MSSALSALSSALSGFGQSSSAAQPSAINGCSSKTTLSDAELQQQTDDQIVQRLMPRPVSSAALSSAPLFGAPTDWTVDSWRSRPIKQQPIYDDKPLLQSQLSMISRLPPLIHPNEIVTLKSQLAECAAGKRFLLQGGDCSESFADCRSPPIEAKLRILLQMSLVLIWGARLPVVRIGRVAGQYGKPRSSNTEKLKDGTVVNSFRGDCVNDFEATAQARRADPCRLVLGHFHSCATLNYIRALIKGGFADLHASAGWKLPGVQNPKRLAEYQHISSGITEALQFMEVCGIQERNNATVTQIDFFTSHEALLLEYESVMTRPCLTLPSGQTSVISSEEAAQHMTKSSSFESSATAVAPLVQHFNLSAHFVWIGNRTRALSDAHVELMRGIANPIGIKVDAEIAPEELVTLLDRIDPNREPGRITLISRFGHSKVTSGLPKLIRAVQSAGRQHTTVWCCDPMHGNTINSANGLKTRRFDDILQEIRLTFACHEECGSHLAGAHFELTGEGQSSAACCLKLELSLVAP